MEYPSMKVPELRKLLQERSLPTTGNKPDLVARLQEDDKSKKEPAAAAQAEDEIDYSDDEVTITTKEPKPAAPELSAVADAAAPTPSISDDAAKVDGAEADAPVNGEADTADAGAATAQDDAPAAEEVDPDKFALHLPPTVAEEEARKRAERAKRFGLVEDEEAKKKAERAKRFGGEVPAVATASLDSALPERPLKRGREGGDQGRGGAKKQSTNQGDNRRQGNSRHQGQGRGGRNKGGRRQGGGGGGGGGGSGILNDPVEKAKAEARAKRFGTAT